MSTVARAGGNLFQVAAEQYGDAMGWADIARANGLIDPDLAGLVQLAIPPTPISSGILDG